MKIIISGAGEVGFHLAKQLSIEEHDISVIDIDLHQLERVDSTTDVLTHHGSSTNISLLKKARVDATDLVVAVSSSESVNINTAIIAKKLGAKKNYCQSF